MMTAEYSDDKVGQFLGIFMPLVFLLAYTMPLLIITIRYADEKENKLRAMMKMMGLGDSTYILSWYTIYLIISTFLSVLILLILSFNVLVKSAAGLVFVFLFLFGASQFGTILIAV
jgi:hypothetical protein